MDDIQAAVEVGAAGSRPGEFPDGHPLAVNPSPESGYRAFGKVAANFAATSESPPAVINPAITPGGMLGNPSVSAVPEGSPADMGDVKG